MVTKLTHIQKHNFYARQKSYRILISWSHIKVACTYGTMVGVTIAVIAVQEKALLILLDCAIEIKRHRIGGGLDSERKIVLGVYSTRKRIGLGMVRFYGKLATNRRVPFLLLHHYRNLRCLRCSRILHTAIIGSRDIRDILRCYRGRCDRCCH